MVAPILDTAEAPKTAKLSTVPSGGAMAATWLADTSDDIPANDSDIVIRTIKIDRYLSLFIIFGLLPKTFNKAGEFLSYYSHLS
jgi:hypothetical protein